MTVSVQKIARVFLFLGLIAFLFLGSFGLSQTSMLMMDADGTMAMSTCPFMSEHAVVCNMHLLEHIAAWQSVFTNVLLQQNSAMLILLLLTALIAGSVWIGLWRSWVEDVSKRVHYVRRRDPVPLLSSLQELFSNGILHAKAF